MLFGCGKSESELLADRLRIEKMQAEIDGIRQQQAEKAAEAKRAADERDRIERQRQLDADREAAQVRAEAEAQTLAIGQLEFTRRPSFIQEGSHVLMIRNASARYVSFQLTCYQQAGASKIFQFSMSPSEATELGFQQGWPGNFTTGEYCKVSFDGKELRKFNVVE